MVLLCAVIIRKGLDNLVQEIAGAAAVGGRNGPDFAQAQGVEIVGVVHLFAGVHFVHAKDDRFLAAAQQVGDFRVIVRNARGGLAHEQDYIRLFDGDAHLPADGVFEDIVRVGRVAARIHYGEFPAAPFALAVMPVARDAGGFIYDCLPHAHQTVEQRALSYVRSPDYRY